MAVIIRRWMTWVWVLPAVVLLGVFVYYPIVDNIHLSLYSWSAFNPNAAFVGLGNYRTAFGDPVFRRSLVNNIFYAVISIVFQVGGSLVLAALLETFVHERLRGILRTIYFIPATISITVAGILFSFLYNPQIGLVNKGLGLVGLGSNHDWLGNPHSAIFAIIGMSQWQSIGYTSIMFIVAIQRIPKELYEAARVDGASAVRTFFSITIPLLREMTTLVTILTLSGAFLVFNEVMVMTAGGPSNSSQVLGTWLYQQAFVQDDMGYAAAIATIIFVITFAISGAQIMYTRRRSVQW